MTYTGVYINLDRSTDRRTAMEEQLSRLRLTSRYQRLPAAEGNTLGVSTTLTGGEIGCLISHYLACKQRVGSNVPVHIVEDDVLFADITMPVICGIAERKLFDDYDILFFDSVFSLFGVDGVRLFGESMRVYESAIERNTMGAAFKVTLMARNYVAGTTSYLVSREAIPKLIAIYECAFADGAAIPVDALIREEARKGSIRAACLFPFVTSIRLDAQQTTIAGREKRNARLELANYMLRHSFFVDRDINALLKIAREALPSTRTDPHHLLLTHLMGLYLEDAFAPP